MDISSITAESTASLQQAIGITMLRKTMNKDAQTAASLIDAMQSANAKVMEQSVTPHKGGSIDARV